MNARLLINHLRRGDIARNYIRLVKDLSHHPQDEAHDASNGAKAQEILETIESQNQPEPDFNIDGKSLIAHMDKGLEDMGLVPYFYTDEARKQGVGIYPHSYVVIVGDPERRTYKTVKVSFRRQSVVIRDVQDGNTFQLPWDLVEPLPVEDQDTPYWFTSAAREKDQDLRVGDYVGLLGSDQKYELMEIFWNGNVRVRAIGSVESLGLPWKYVRPWKNGE